MKTIFASFATVALCLAMPSAANAAATITFGPPQADGSISGTFESQGIQAGTFSDILMFNFDQFGIGNATISSIFQVSDVNNIDFTSVTFNGTNFDIGSSGDVEFRFLRGLAISPGLQTLGIKAIIYLRKQMCDVRGFETGRRY